MMCWQDDITRELQAVARAEARERLSVEAQLLCTGNVDREAVPAVLRPVLALGWWRMQVRAPLAAPGHARRRVVGEAG
jgi:hypothetical protein